MTQILGRYVGLAPEKLVFGYGAKGKPELLGGLEESRINLSNSSEVALLAVAQGLIVGIDIELVNPEFAAAEVAERFFSASEADILRALPSGERAEACFSCWTRKERNCNV